jgi:hypothetical protein
MLEGSVPRRFEVARQLGEGGMGTVYEALDTETGRRVALKLMRGGNADALVRFKREFRALQDLHHPNLVTLGELVSEGDQWFFTMELVHGVDFVTWVSGQADGAAPERALRFDEQRLRGALAQLAQALAALHEAHMVHRDVKPSNVLVEPSGRVVVVDFGLVADVQEMGRGVTDLDVVGTPAYMAPEQAASRPVGPAADWYSVGVLLHEAMTGTVPFDGAPLEILLRKQRDEPRPPSATVPDLPADLDELCARLLRFDPALRPTDRQMLRATGAPPERAAKALGSATVSLGVPFVGREPELASLRAAYDRVRETGRALTVLVRGESGIGKSCLVRHFTDLVAADDVQLLVFSGRCYEREAVPYKALDGVIDQIARFLGRMRFADVAQYMPTRPGPLIKVFPALRRIEAISQMRHPSEAPVDVHELRERAFSSVRELISRLAARRPVIIVIDDLQWADEDSLALLQALIRGPEEPSVLFIATIRDAPDPTTSTRIRRDPEEAIPGEVRKIALARLGKKDAHDLAARLVERVGPGIPLSVDTLAEEADGHPLFLDEIVRHLFSVGAPQGALRLEEALWGRITSLEDVPRRVVELCAIAGAPLPQAAVARAVDATPSDFARVVSFLRVAHLVLTTGARTSETMECFHARIREAVVRHLSTAEKRERHEQLAVALESAADADPDLLALLWLGAGDVDKAAAHMLTAAGRAAGALAFDRAARLYERALELRGRGTRPMTRDEERTLQTKLGDAFSNAGHGPRAARAYRAAAEGANAAEGLDLRRRAADQLLRSGHFDEGVAASMEVLQSIGLRMPTSPLQALLGLIFWRVVILVRGLRFQLIDKSAVSARKLTTIDVSNSIATSLSLIDPICGNLFHARNLVAALRAGEGERIARALALEVSYRGVEGGPSWEKTMAISNEARRVASAVGSPFAIAMSLGTSAVAHYLAGRFVESLEMCREAERTLIQCEGATWEAITMRFFTIQSLSHLGRFRELRAQQETALRLALERGDLYAAVNLRIGHPTMAWLAADDPERVRREARAAMRQWSTQGFHLEHYYESIGLTNADLYEDRPKEALARIAERWQPMRRSHLMRVQTIRLYARNMRARAAIALAEREPASRKSLFAMAESDVRQIEREAMPWTGPGSHLVLAATAWLRGDAAKAVSVLERTVDLATQNQATLIIAGARFALGASKGGAEGDDLKKQAVDALASEGVVNPRKLIAVIAPGFGAARP